MSSDWKNKTDKELAAALSEKRTASRNFKFGVAGSKVRNTKEGREIRKEIARILTEINARKK